MRDVHRRRDEHRPVVRERGLGEDVVREPVREPRERVRRQRRDDEEIGALEVRVRAFGRLAGERVERLRGDEALGAAAVTTGSTSCPARTSSRTSVHAL